MPRREYRLAEYRKLVSVTRKMCTCTCRCWSPLCKISFGIPMTGLWWTSIFSSCSQKEQLLGLSCPSWQFVSHCLQTMNKTSIPRILTSCWIATLSAKQAFVTWKKKKRNEFQRTSKNEFQSRQSEWAIFVIFSPRGRLISNCFEDIGWSGESYISNSIEVDLN